MSKEEYKPLQGFDARAVQPPSFLGGPFGEEVNKEVQRIYGKYDVINKINYNPKTGFVEGSNPYYVVAVNKVLRKNNLGIRTATQADLERILKSREMNFERTYVETAIGLKEQDYLETRTDKQKKLEEGFIEFHNEMKLEKDPIKNGKMNSAYHMNLIYNLDVKPDEINYVLENLEDHNSYLTEILMNQVKLVKPNQKIDLMIPLKCLELEKDKNAKYGLVFKLRDESELFELPPFEENYGYFSSNDVDKTTGLPKQLQSARIDKTTGLPKPLGDRNRIFYINDFGLSVLKMDGGLHLNLKRHNLNNSNSWGKIVLIRDKGPTNKK